jgi:hypothetical protein
MRLEPACSANPTPRTPQHRYHPHYPQAPRGASSYPHYLPPQPALALQTGARTRRYVHGPNPARMRSLTPQIRGLDGLLFPSLPFTSCPKSTFVYHAAFSFSPPTATAAAFLPRPGL